jgi:hypothetical protein
MLYEKAVNEENRTRQEELAADPHSWPGRKLVLGSIRNCEQAGIVGHLAMLPIVVVHHARMPLLECST